MHVHSTASELSKLGIQRSLSLPECATEPAEVYELAKARGMDFVTITDHDTVAGVLQISHLPDVFVSEELTVSFRNEPQKVHVLCYGISEDDHEWLQAHNHCVEECAAYLDDHGIVAALAHPFYAVGAPLGARHRRRLAELFPIWETRNGSRAKELNLPAFVYIETRGGTGIGGSDDHAGIDIGRTFTETPRAADPTRFLEYLRVGEAISRGSQGSAAKWTHAAMALAIRSLSDQGERTRPDPGALLTIVQRVLSEGNSRVGETRSDVGPGDAIALLRGWLAAMDLGGDERALLKRLQDGDVGHDDLERRARRIHERELARVVGDIWTDLDGGRIPEFGKTGAEFFDACLPVIPYAAATAFLGREKHKLSRAEGDRLRVALVADGISSTHGVASTIKQVRERGVPGFEVEVIGTDPDVDRRLASVAEVDVPFYNGIKLGVPSIPAITDAIAEGRYDLVHVCAPGPAGAAAWALAKALELPLLGSYHTELGSYAGVRSGQPMLEAMTSYILGQFYGGCDVVLSPSAATDKRLREIGIESGKVGRWDRGVDLARFSPENRDPELLDGEVKVLYAGRLTTEKGVELLADAFLAARAKDPRLHLNLAGDGPERAALEQRLGDSATFLGWQHGEDLARVYASADVFLFASRTDTFGQVIREAQASGLPVVAVAEGGPVSLIEDGQTGLLSLPETTPLSAALLRVVANPMFAERLKQGGLRKVKTCTWEAAMRRLAAGYRRAVRPAVEAGRDVA